MNFSQRCSDSCLVLRARLKILRCLTLSRVTNSKTKRRASEARPCRFYEHDRVDLARSYGYRRKESVALYREKSASRQAVHCATRDRRSLTRRMKSRQPVLDRDRELAARIVDSFDRYILLYTVSNSLFPS